MQYITESFAFVLSCHYYITLATYCSCAQVTSTNTSQQCQEPPCPLLLQNQCAPSSLIITDHFLQISTSEECTIPGVTCQALYSPLFMYNFHLFFEFIYILISVSDRIHMTFKFIYAILVLTNIFVLNIILQVLYDI